MANSKLSNHYGFVKPNDIRALELMNAAAQHVVHVLPDVVISYGHSDEYSFVFHKSCTLFERRAAKISSTVVSTFTAAYVYLWAGYFSSPPPPGTFFASINDGCSNAIDTKVMDSNHDQSGSLPSRASTTKLDLAFLPTFDARYISYPSNTNLRDYLSWRQADCHINNLYNTTFWALVLKGGMTNTEAEDFLKGTLSSDKHEILWSRFGINYNDQRQIFKKGSVVLREYELTNLPEAEAQKDSISDDTEVGSTCGVEPSKTQRERMRKARQKAKIVVQHVDIIKNEFWLQRPWLLSGRPGNPI